MAETARVARISRRSVIAVAAVSAATLAFAPSWGAGRTAQSESFFASGNAAAHWDNTEPDSDSDGWSQIYDVQDATSYAGTTLHHVEGLPAPATPPSSWKTAPGACGTPPAPAGPSTKADRATTTTSSTPSRARRRRRGGGWDR